MQTLVFYISGHGFGHAARQVEVIRALRARRAGLAIIVKTSAPAWLFERFHDEPVEVAPLETDTGVVQVDSLTVDVAASVTAARAFHDQLDARAKAEATWLHAHRARLVVGDIPPLAFAAAAAADIPSAAVSNFTWDWIYAAYNETRDLAPSLVPTLASAYARATVAWRLPLHGGFESCPRVVDAPLVARRATCEPGVVRRQLGLPAHAPLVLVAFGRYGIADIDWSAVGALEEYRIVFTDATAPPVGSPTVASGRFVVIDEREMDRCGMRYEDLVAAVEVVVTKPGYGMIAECAANDAAMLYTSRGRFREYDVLTSGLPGLIRSHFIPHDDLFAGRWAPHLDALLNQPRPAPARVDGAQVIADALVRML